MKKSIFLLLTFMYSAVFAESWKQEITVINTTNVTLYQSAMIFSGKFDGDFDNKVLLPYSTNVITATANDPNGDSLVLSYWLQPDNKDPGVAWVAMDDEVVSTFQIECMTNDPFICEAMLINGDKAHYKGRMIIKY